MGQCFVDSAWMHFHKHKQNACCAHTLSDSLHYSYSQWSTKFLLASLDCSPVSFDFLICLRRVFIKGLNADISVSPRHSSRFTLFFLFAATIRNIIYTKRTRFNKCIFIIACCICLALHHMFIQQIG